MVDVKGAAGAYINALEQMNKSVPSQDSNSDINGTSFGDMLKTSLNSAVDAQHTSEKVSASAVMGQANITDVLQAVTEAEMKLDTVLAIRDRVISAYEQIMRSPI